MGKFSSTQVKTSIWASDFLFFGAIFFLGESGTPYLYNRGNLQNICPFKILGNPETGIQSIKADHTHLHRATTSIKLTHAPYIHRIYFHYYHFYLENI